MILTAIFAPILAPYDPYETSFLEQLEPPSREPLARHRCFRTRRSVALDLWLADGAARLALALRSLAARSGALLGVIGAYFGGKVDLFLERVMDVLISFPLLILALAVVSALGNNDVNVIVAITIPIIPRVARVIRASALSIRQMHVRRGGALHRRRLILGSCRSTCCRTSWRRS